MARGLFLEIASHGHVNPTIGLVSELVKMGDEIVYVSYEAFRDKFEKIGAKFIGYTPESLINIRNKGNFDNVVNYLPVVKELRKIISEVAMKQEGTFDYLILDNTIKINKDVLKKFNIKKVISLSTTFALNKELINQLLENIRFSDSHTQEFNEKCKAEILEFLEPVLLKEKADLKIVFTSKYFQPYADEFNSTYKFVGPSIFDRHELEDFKIENSDNKKVVFISLGTVVNKKLDFYNECFEALASRDDLIVIMSIGERVSIKDLGKIPENFKVYNYVPQLEVLKKVDLFITHGGMNSTNEGLYNGIPLIVVPQAGDQPIVAKRVEELGAGVALIDNVNSDSISEAVNRVLSNNFYEVYKKNAEKIGKSLRECGGYKRAADIIHNELDI